MALALYMDQHVPKAIANGLRLCSVDVLTAYEDGAGEFDDPNLLDRARELKRVLFTQDDDLLSEAANRLRENIPFYGVIYAHQLQISIGVCVRDLELIAKVGEPEDIVNKVQFLPL
jgi:predicted nuclease of predicted toxin-antitoxin system